MPRMTFDEITKTATSDDRMSAKNRILFHYFNPNGCYAALQALHKRIDAWVKAHPERPNGVILVHGGLNDYPGDRLRAALDAPKKRKAVTYTIDSAIRGVERAIRDGDAFLADESQWPAPKG